MEQGEQHQTGSVPDVDSSPPRQEAPPPWTEVPQQLTPIELAAVRRILAREQSPWHKWIRKAEIAHLLYWVLIAGWSLMAVGCFYR